MPILPVHSPRNFTAGSSTRSTISKYWATLWFFTSTVTFLIIIGFIGVDPQGNRTATNVLNDAVHQVLSDTSTVKLFLSESLIGSPAIGAPPEVEEDVIYDDVAPLDTESVGYSSYSLTDFWNREAGQDNISQDSYEDDLLDTRQGS